MSTVEPEAQAVPTLPRRRRWRRLLNVLMAAAIVASLLVGLLRVASLWGIPDAPEPFDVAAYVGETIPADRDAAVLFREAERALGSEPSWAFRNLPATILTLNEDWSRARPDVRARVDEYRPALEAWRRATGRPDMTTPRSTARPYRTEVESWGIAWLYLAGLEAGRLEQAGDLAGAWAWLQARLRAALLYGRRRGVGAWGRQVWGEVFSGAARGAADWAELPGLTVPLLRRAIADVEAMGPLIGSEADSIKADYLAVMAQIDDYAAHPPSLAAAASELNAAALGLPRAGRPMGAVPASWSHPIGAKVASFVEAEPERSKRLARMLFANWLAQADRKPPDRAATVSTYPLVFDEDAGPTPSLPPSALARRAATGPYLAIARGGFAPPIWWVSPPDQWPTTYRAERQTRADLILALADRIYEIENGKPPETVEDLVGTVLPKLPEDYGPSTAPAPGSPDP